MQSLLTATGSVSRSTKIMNVALDLAASRNADVASVAKDLASAYVGNTKGLNQYKLGLTKAELAAMTFDEILEKIGSQTLGAADEAAKTLSGQLAILAEVSNQAKERIGGGLVQALGAFSGDAGAAGAAKTIENLSIKLTNAITGFGYLVQEVKIAQPILVAAGIAIGLAWAPWFTALGVAAVAIGAIGNAMKKNTPQVPMNTGKLMFPTAGDGGYKERLAAEKKAEAAAAARAKALAASIKAQTKAQQDAFKLSKAKSIFDMEKIQIEAALKGKISEEERIRLKLMKAIADENAGAIDKLLEQLKDAEKKTADMQKLLDTIKTLEIQDPFGTWKIDPLTESINALTKSIGGVGTAISATGTEWSSFTGNVAKTVIKPNLTEWSSSFGKATEEVTSSFNKATTSLNKLKDDATNALKTDADSTVNKFTNDADQTLQQVEQILSAEVAALAAAIAAASTQAAADAADLAGAGNAGSSVAITVNTGIGDPNAIAEAIQQVIIDAGNRGTIDAQGIL